MPENQRWSPAYIGLGANLGDARQTLTDAVADIGRVAEVRLVLRSSLYKSAPMGLQDQPDYLNAAVAVLTRLRPHALLMALQDIEKAHGRKRDGQRWGPRTLDLDLLVFSNQKIDESGLSIPHPGLPERNFVLYPLAEIASRLEIPGAGIVEDMARALGSEGLEKLE